MISDRAVFMNGFIIPASKLSLFILFQASLYRLNNSGIEAEDDPNLDSNADFKA